MTLGPLKDQIAEAGIISILSIFGFKPPSLQPYEQTQLENTLLFTLLGEVVAKHREKQVECRATDHPAENQDFASTKIKVSMKLLLLPFLIVVSTVSAQTTTTTTTTTTTVTTAPIEQEIPVFIQPRASVPERLTVAESRLQIASYWNHNGSTMGLLMNGNQRILIYIRPRRDLEGLVEPGTVLFVGESENGRYTGKARRFSRGLPPIEYDVDGTILNGGNKVVLSGLAPIRNPDGSIKNVIEDRLEFSYLQLAE